MYQGVSAILVLVPPTWRLVAERSGDLDGRVGQLHDRLEVRSITLHQPLRVKEATPAIAGVECYAIEGTPADSVIVGAGTQSNWCRQTAASARKLGMDAYLVLSKGFIGPGVQGNLFLDQLMGAQVEIIEGDVGTDPTPIMERMKAKASELSSQGGKPYILDLFEKDAPLAAASYMDAYLELRQQLEEADLQADYLFLAAAGSALALSEPDFAWVQTYEGGGSYVDDVTTTLSDAAGNLIIAGVSFDGVEGLDMLICKMAGEDGEILWETRVPAFDGADMATSGMVPDGFGDLLVCGYVVGCEG